jgi:hypothetical protein
VSRQGSIVECPVLSHGHVFRIYHRDSVR